MSKVKAEETWLDISKQKNTHLFSELDALLRALDRFFILETHFAAKEHFSRKNLHPELAAVKDGILRTLSILEYIIPESNRNAYWFQKFAESKLLDNRRRDIVRAGMYKQNTPEKSMYVLYDSFISFKSLVSDILKNPGIEYMSFQNIGQVITKELRENEFFNPFRQDINLELDFIVNREIKGIVKNVNNQGTKKTASILFLHLFRILRYMSHMDHKSMNQIAISKSLLIFSLLKSEIEVFRTYIEKTTEELKDEELVMLLKALSYQFSMESKRVFQQEMKDIFEKKSPSQFRSKIENSRGILKNLTEQTIIQLAKYWKPNINGERIFDFFINKTAQSVKLREDIYVLNRLLMGVQKKAGSTDEGRNSFRVLMNYMDYFEDFSFKLIRYDDFEEFSRLFFQIKGDYKNNVETGKLLESCHLFNIFLDTTLRQIHNRAELKNRKFDIDKMEDFVRQYLPA